MSLERALVLNRYIHHQFGSERFEPIKKALQPCQEGAADDGHSHFYHTLASRTGLLVAVERLAAYYERALRYEADLKRNRRTEIFRSFKYFQYLAVLYTEILLDRLTDDPTGLLADLNRFRVARPDFAEIPDFDADDLRRAAYFMATGSGKTLIMHVNIRQVLHYLAHGLHPEALVRRADGRREFDSILLITPGEGLSDQHLRDLGESGLDAARFIEDRTPGGLFGPKVKVIEIHKLAEEKSAEGVSVPLEEIGDRNLVIVDEGHKGTGSDARTWKTRQQTLSRNGFLLEYSATFAQAIGGAPGKARTALLAEYGKAIVCDYSYRHFYADGYGKTFRVLNLKRGGAKHAHDLMLGGLLVFYQQSRVYQDQAEALRPYNIEKPLWVLLGTSVSKKRNDASRAAQDERTDVGHVVEFLRHFLEDTAWATERIAKTMAGESGFVDRDTGLDLFSMLKAKDLGGENPDALYRRICRDVFHGQGGLEVWDLKNSAEIGLRVSAGAKELPYFGVINIGDVPSFLKHVEDDIGVPVKDDRFTGSLFAEISKPASPIGMLVGAKKFIEGWSSWRVSSMGLMNVGKGEGSQVIQLFGRGIRLKGRDMSLKRSAGDAGGAAPAGLGHLETLYIFGWNADYMQIFREMLDREDLPRQLSPLRVRQQEPWPDWLYVPVRPAGCEWKAETWTLDDSGPNITMDLRPQVASVAGDGGATVLAEGVTGETAMVRFTEAPYADLVDSDALYRDLVEHKAQQGMGHIFVSREAVRAILEKKCELRMLKDEAGIPAVLHGAVLKALKSYLERYARQAERQYDGEHAVPGVVDRETQVVREYSVTVYGTDDGTGILKEIETALKKPVDEMIKAKETDATLPRLYLDWHLFNPLVVQGGTEDWKEGRVTVVPPALGPGERQLVDDLCRFWRGHNGDSEYKDMNVCLLRNLPKVGIGLFRGSGFYPDFILWLRNKKTRQVNVLFVDPHGLHHGGLAGNEDRFQALKKLAAVAAGDLFKRKKMTMAGRILARADTPLDKIPGAEKLTWADIECQYPVLRQTGEYVARLMKYAMPQ